MYLIMDAYAVFDYILALVYSKPVLGLLDIIHFSYFEGFRYLPRLELKTAFNPNQPEQIKRLHVRAYPPCPLTWGMAIVEVKNLGTGLPENPTTLRTGPEYTLVTYNRLGTQSAIRKPGYATNTHMGTTDPTYMYVPVIGSTDSCAVAYLTGPISNPQPVRFE